jgi:hypothetical protein
MESQTPNTVAVVIWADRHSDTDAYVYRHTADAIEWAKRQVREYGHPEDIDEELTDGMRQDGWLYYGKYSCEGCSDAG